MIYSTTCAYAIHAVCRLVVLAERDAGYARVHEICRNSDLPPFFVSKILRDLVRAGLLKSAKGRNGGFGLAKSAEKIRLLDIVEVIDGLRPYRQCISGLAECNDRQPCPQHDSFKPVRQRIINYLTETTLRQTADSMVRKSELIGVPLFAETNAQEGSDAAPSEKIKRGGKAVPGRTPRRVRITG